MPGVCLCHKEIDRFPSSSTAPKSEILGCTIQLLPLAQMVCSAKAALLINPETLVRASSRAP